MTSSSKDSLPTPQQKLDTILMNLADGVMEMKRLLDEQHCIPTEALSDFHGQVGELIWTSGAVEAVQIVAQENQSKIEVIH